MTATGLWKGTLQYGKELSKKFDEETVKAKTESELNTVADINLLNEDQVNSEGNEDITNQNNIDSDSETE